MKSWFHEATYPKIACVAIAGFIRGTTIWLKILNSPAPSILADCTISIESEACRYCLIKNTVIGAAIAGMISMKSLFVNPIL